MTASAATTATTAFWGPGAGRAMVWADGMALVEDTITDSATVALWNSLQRATGVGQFLEALSAATGASLLALPGFGVVLRSGTTVHVAARGHVVVEVGTAQGPQLIDADGAATWIERTIESAEAVTIRGSSAAATAAFPILAGVVPAGCLSTAPVRNDAAPSGADPSGAAQPVSVPRSAPAVPAGGAILLPEDSVPSESPVPSDDPVVPEDLGRSVDSRPPEDPEEQPSAPADDAQQAPDEDDEFAALFGETTYQPIEDAAVRLKDPSASEFISAVPGRGPGPVPAVDQDPGDVLGDHDGMTIMSLDGLLPTSGTPAPGSAPASPDQASGPLVLALICPAGHASPAHRTTCRVCGAPILGSPVQVPRPALGRMLTADGESIDLDQEVILGRSPRAERVRAMEVPRLVPLPYPHISGSHLAIRLEGWSVLAQDLHSRNGTFLRRRGEPPVRLGDQPLPLTSADILDLGRGVQLRFEELP